MKTANYFFLTAFLITIVFNSCDPAHNGTSYIRNESSYALLLKFNNYDRDSTLLIQPHSLVDFYNLGGLGAGKGYNCCPCDFKTISLQPTDTTKRMIKNITDSDQWILTNPNRNRFQNKEIECEFSVTQSDIQ
jgi:hypothetical protein